MIRVATPGVATTVSFHPASPGGGGTAGPSQRTVPDVQVLVGVEELTLEDLKAHEVQVDRVRVLGHVEKLPHLHRAELRLLRHGVVPVRAVEQHQHPVRGRVVVVVERQPARLHGGRGLEPRHLPELRR